MDTMQAPGQQAARWTVAELTRDAGWIYRLAPEDAATLLAAVRRAHVPGKPLLDYRPADVDLGPAKAVIAAAFEEQRSGRGLALLKGLPRAGVSLAEFELLTWAIGLHFGVARGRRARRASTSPPCAMPAPPTAAPPGAAIPPMPGSTSISMAPMSRC